MPTSARTRRRRVCSKKALWRHRPGGRLIAAPTAGSRPVAFIASALAMKPFGRAMRAPTSKTVVWWDVGADAHIGPNPPEAGLFEEGTLAAQARRAADSRPYGGVAACCVCRKRSSNAGKRVHGSLRLPQAFKRRQSGTASGGALFTAEKCRKRAGGCGPRTPLGLRGVHPKKRHLPGRHAPPGCPVPYCLPLPGFARASRIGQPLRLHNVSLRPHQLPRNVG